MLVCSIVVMAEEDSTDHGTKGPILTQQQRFINWGNVDFGCTLSCGFYNYCVVLNRNDCVRPRGCECSVFA